MSTTGIEDLEAAACIHGGCAIGLFREASNNYDQRTLPKVTTDERGYTKVSISNTAGYGSNPTAMIEKAQQVLDARPCDYVKNGQCRIAQAAIQVALNQEKI